MNKGGYFYDILLMFSPEDITDIAEGGAEDARHGLNRKDTGPIVLHDFLVAVGIVKAVFAAYVAAMVFPLVFQRGGPAINHFGPQGINIDIIGIVEHIGG